MKKISILILLTLVLQSCYNDNEEEIYGPVTCDLSDVTYANQVSSVINSSCATTGCHVAGGTGSGDFTVFDELKSKVDNGSFENRVLVEKTMPPSSQLQDCDLQILQSWLDNGALNN